jgi:hypothetical protein
MPAIRGARPIRNSEILQFHNNVDLKPVSQEEYTAIFREWLNYSDNKSIIGLENFAYADYTQGTSQTFDHFVMKHSKDRCVTALRGEFQYHRCISKFVEFKELIHIHPDLLHGKDSHALLLSAPFSDFGTIHPEFEIVLDICNDFNIPVCLDIAYWGIAKNVHINLNDYPCIKEVTCSLSKPFFTLENHRVGVRFTRDYADDGISMLNEVKMANNHSMALGTAYMKAFTPDYNWDKYKNQYEDVCLENNLIYTDTVIFGLGDEERHAEFHRGVPFNYRVCVSEWLGDC